MTSQPSEPMTQEEVIARLKSFSFGHLQEACEMAIAAMRREGELIEAAKFVREIALEHMGFKSYSAIEQRALDDLFAAIAKADQPPGA